MATFSSRETASIGGRALARTASNGSSDEEEREVEKGRVLLLKDYN